MKLNIISDLHCGTTDNGDIDWFDFEPEKLEPADYLIVAGDTGYAVTERKIHKELRERTKGKFKKILTIKGNHSYWVIPDDPLNEPADEEFMAGNDKIDLVDGNVAIIGTTLWTNSCKMHEVRYMNDYRYIPTFTPELKLARFKEESEWLRWKYKEYKAQGKKIVIVTHHNPRTPDELPEYSWEHGDVYTAYWVVNHELDDLKPDIWICGHIHEDLDTEIDGVRFIRHPIGYRWGWYGMRPEKFPEHQKIIDSWYNKVIEIDSNPTMESEMAFYRKLSDEQAERSERMMYE